MERTITHLAELVHHFTICELHAEKDFSEAAERALLEADLSPLEDTARLVQWLYSSPSLPPAQSGENDFGYPTITVYRCDSFRIEIIFWPGFPTGEHDHTAPGAFAVLHGPRLHFQYSFSPSQQLQPGFWIGRMMLKSMDILHVRDVRTITAQDGLIHSLFFLERPSVTVSIRSQNQQSKGCAYRRPGIRFDRAFEDLERSKREQSLYSLVLTRPRALMDLVERIASSCNPIDQYFLLRAFNAHMTQTQIQELVSKIIRASDEAAELVTEALACERRRSRINQVVGMKNDIELLILSGLLWAPGPGNVISELFRKLIASEESNVSLLTLFERCWPNGYIEENVEGADPEVWSGCMLELYRLLLEKREFSHIVAYLKSRESRIS